MIFTQTSPNYPVNHWNAELESSAKYIRNISPYQKDDILHLNNVRSLFAVLFCCEDCLCRNIIRLDSIPEFLVGIIQLYILSESFTRN